MTKKSMWVIILVVISLMILIVGYVSPLPEKQPSPEETIPTETEAKTLFLENFESGIQNWSLEEGWYLERIGNNTVLKGRGHKWARLENRGWDNYAFKAKFKLIQGTIHFNYRHSELEDGPHRYFIGVSSDVLYLNKQIGNKFYDLAEASIKLDNGWHEIEIRGYEDIINIYIDDNIHIFYKDDDPILSGSIAFETLEDSDFLIDDVEIRETLPSDIVTELGLVRIHNASKSGTLTRDEIWGGEIYVMDHVFVPEGVTLTMEPGTVVKLKHYRGYKEPWKKLSIVIGGTLEAVGTPEEQICFTSDAPDPINGDWCMLRFENTENDSIIMYAVIEFAQQGINMWNSSPTISHTIVRWNNWEGIYLESYCKPLLEYNQIYENGYNGVAMEQFNEATLRYNTIMRSGTSGIHVDASTARIEYNIVQENRANGLSVDDHGTIIALNNTIEDNLGAGIGLGEGLNRVTAQGNKFRNNSHDIDSPPPSIIVENIPGDGVGEIVYDYSDPRPYELGYIPGDPEKDRYMYIYPNDDETRRVVKKIGEGLGLTWSVTWDGEYIWTAALWGDVYKLDAETGEIKTHWKFPGPQAWGMTYDSNHLWINDFAEKTVYEMDSSGNVISYFAIPDQTGGAKGITWDGEYLFLMGWTSPTIYKVDKAGNLLETIQVRRGHAGGGLTWDGKYFWAPGGKGICKIDRSGQIVGEVYAASEGTWDLAWDGNGDYLWATQRTNENWQDPKIYKIEIIDDSLK
jgi:parallel beta-helix repeat protein